ncbi:hypothetical protein ANN_05080 [Periplaneta americana]|uniref:Acyltransferase 3 domain-containing protein n=1 Tax=Periplaneta americana TaxID=6978 RepID=A0ABQ8TA30_PERAM|nr:hypothetical protein ANN_05080 [Periplaneta americana]
MQCYKKLLPDVPLPPQPEITRWGTWIGAVNYFFNEHFVTVKSVVKTFSLENASSVRESMNVVSITPLLGLAVLLQVSFLDKLGSGPIWDFLYQKKEKANCVENWWVTLLNVQNYVNVEKQCISPSWYLAVDMQLFWISPIFLLSLHKWPRFGLVLTAATGIAGMIAAFIESYIREDNPDFIHLGTSADLGYSYYHTHTRCTSWFVGLLCGYLLHRTSDWRKRVAMNIDGLSKVTITSGWLLTIIASVIVYSSIYPFVQKDHKYDALQAAFYYALARPVWSVCVAWIIFACVSGYGGSMPPAVYFIIVAYKRCQIYCPMILQRNAFVDAKYYFLIFCVCYIILFI